MEIRRTPDGKQKDTRQIVTRHNKPEISCVGTLKLNLLVHYCILLEKNRHNGEGGGGTTTEASPHTTDRRRPKRLIEVGYRVPPPKNETVILEICEQSKSPNQQSKILFQNFI